MKAQLQAQVAYSTVQSPALRTPRRIEYELFASITTQMRAAADDPAMYPALVAALHRNRRLWTTLAADVADDQNALPKDLRARLFYLAEFTQEHTRKVLTGGEDVGVLIDINTAVMRGLSGHGGRP